ncbi:endonuclease domain-containing 1 protein-like [Pholidichthys leucotaenia]
MVSLQMWPLFLPLLLLLHIAPPAPAEVVRSLSACDHFLLDKTPPMVPGVLEDGKILNQNRYKPICQTYRNQRRFVTLYDVKNKIPMFSAYRYRGEVERKRPKTHWKIEPQLENENAGKNMVGRNTTEVYNHQATDTDFRSNRTFDRGHIFPSSHASTRDDKLSTFTLTNIVPQAGTFNKGSWNRMEMCVKCVMDRYCVNGSGGTEGFVVTGARPSSSKVLNNKINIPSTLWSAFCCYSSRMEAWVASAHWGANVPDDSRHKHLQTKTLAELYTQLRMEDSEFNLFPGSQCPLHTTVTNLYPELKKCHCPASSSPSLTSLTSTSGLKSPYYAFWGVLFILVGYD